MTKSVDRSSRWVNHATQVLSIFIAVTLSCLSISRISENHREIDVNEHPITKTVVRPAEVQEELSSDTRTIIPKDPQSVAVEFLNNLSTISDTGMDKESARMWMMMFNFSISDPIRRDIGRTGVVDRNLLYTKINKSIDNAGNNFFLNNMQTFYHSTYGELSDQDRLIYKVMTANSKAILSTYDIKVREVDKSKFIYNSDGSITVPFESLIFFKPLSLELEKNAAKEAIPNIVLKKDKYGNYKVDSSKFITDSFMGVANYGSLAQKNNTGKKTIQTDA